MGVGAVFAFSSPSWRETHRENSEPSMVIMRRVLLIMCKRTNMVDKPDTFVETSDYGLIKDGPPVVSTCHGQMSKSFRRT